MKDTFLLDSLNLMGLQFFSFFAHMLFNFTVVSVFGAIDSSCTDPLLCKAVPDIVCSLAVEVFHMSNRYRFSASFRLYPMRFVEICKC